MRHDYFFVSELIATQFDHIYDTILHMYFTGVDRRSPFKPSVFFGNNLVLVSFGQVEVLLELLLNSLDKLKRNLVFMEQELLHRFVYS